MSNLTNVTLVNGSASSANGVVSTIDALMADGGQATLGAKADAASTATDTTAVSGVSVWKQISKSVQAIAASLTGSISVTGTFFQATQPAVLVAGSAIVGKVGIDQTTPGTTNLVQTPAPAAVIAGQAKIAVTSTAVALGSNALVNGIVVKAAKTNVANILIGPSGVTTTYDGTGNGYCLEPGAAMSFACSNTNLIFINGTAGDFVSFGGN